MRMTHDSKPTGPLAGLRVLDFTALLQGPLATQVLADLGADVVKLEKPGGEWMRHWGIFDARTHGETDAFLAFNRNKRSIEVDLAQAGDKQRVLDLASKADIVVENFRPGVMDKLGLGYEALRERNPQLIYAAACGYGRTGPYVKKPGQDYLVQALTGAMWLTGRRSDPPLLFGVAVIDQFAGLHLVIAMLAALQHLHRTGEGQRVDIDLLSCALAIQQQELTVYLNHGFLPERPQENVGHPGITAPCGVYATRDSHLLLAMTPCPVLAQILGLDWLAAYDSNEKMLASRDDVHRRLATHFATESTAHWIERLAQHDVWCAPVKTYAQLEDDPQIAHKRLFWDVPYADGDATYRTVGSPFNFSISGPALVRGAPRPGQHNAAFRDGSLWPD
jgi:crotonobetainyl-CoA:carnitine CoA-transferase CaiB-like acyl-CoA transferase